MRFLHGLMKFVISISLLALGIFFLADVFGVQNSIGQLILGDAIGKFVTGTLLILMVMLYWLTAMSGSAKEQFLSFETEGGTVNRISAVARTVPAREAQAMTEAYMAAAMPE